MHQSMFWLEPYLRRDEYGFGLWRRGDEESFAPFVNGAAEAENLRATLGARLLEDGVLLTEITCTPRPGPAPKAVAIQTGIDCYMEGYPQWDNKFFPTAQRCERRGFWAVYRTPGGRMLSLCSPCPTAGWSNVYNRWKMLGAIDDVGHRVYTTRIHLADAAPQPPRHPAIPRLAPGEAYIYRLYWKEVETQAEAFAFIRQYAGLAIPTLGKYTCEPGERVESDLPLRAAGPRPPMDLDGLAPGRYTLLEEETGAEARIFVRRPWMYYLAAARRSADACQQKPGTHCESWYGYFSKVAYAKRAGDSDYARRVAGEFEAFFARMTNRRGLLRPGADPKRLQNVSALLSLLSDFYELTGDGAYLQKARPLAEYLMGLQAKDGSFRSHGVHYTCVIYPAKSLMELALSEKAAGNNALYSRYMASVKRAVLDLAGRMDNIETEGQMTFEDGMISCEALQLAFYALHTEDEALRTRCTEAAAALLEKHRCLEQQYLPDARVRGASLRFWEARYDLNIGSNMLNSPHGWTSWKTYATYYLYRLTGRAAYLKDTMDTLGACMQCVDDDGVLRWGFVADPSVRCRVPQPGGGPKKIRFAEKTVGEQYLPMISSWFRQPEGKLRFQYILLLNSRLSRRLNYGGSCDNNVHEHFKCLDETVFGKAFIHFEAGEPLCYNCRHTGGAFKTEDAYVTQYIVYSHRERQAIIEGESVHIQPGFQTIQRNTHTKGERT